MHACCSQLAESSKHGAALREERERCARLMREAALMKEARKAEAERAAALKHKLSDALEARSHMEAKLAQTTAVDQAGAPAVRANRELEKEVRALLPSPALPYFSPPSAASVTIAIPASLPCLPTLQAAHAHFPSMHVLQHDTTPNSV